MASCRTIAAGQIVGTVIPRSVCERCVLLGSPPNALTEQYRDQTRYGRIVQAHIADGPTDAYRISVEEAVVGMIDKDKMQEAVLKSLDRGHQTPRVAIPLLREHGGDDPVRDVGILEDAVAAGRLTPGDAAGIAGELGL